MPQVTARLPEPLVKEMDRAAKRLRRTRADLIRQAVEYYLDDLEDLKLGLERLQDPADAVLDWKDVRRELLSQD
jgi:RHH-type transcriptional regulator, rel operon repressor / antitoxin RelB